MKSVIWGWESFSLCVSVRTFDTIIHIPLEDYKAREKEEFNPVYKFDISIVPSLYKFALHK